jgi:hypothetical protein
MFKKNSGTKKIDTFKKFLTPFPQKKQKKTHIIKIPGPKKWVHLNI